MRHPPALVLGLSAGLCALALSACHRAPQPASAPVTGHCLASADGYLRARLRGAHNEDIEWHDVDMQCEGGPRPADQGVRVAFAGPRGPTGQRLRFVFGIDGVGEHQAGQHLPTNVTVIEEGSAHVYSTQGSDKCNIDEFSQRALPSRGTLRRYRVSARGFCTDPATEPGSGSTLLISRFDFVGLLTFGDS
jgi:hypothetical protein